MLSGELSTYLSGRYIEFHIHSLSFTEFLEFHHLPATNQSLILYLTYGGLPYLSRLALTDELAFEYLRNIPDNYPKYVVSLDEFNQGSEIAGIVHLYLLDFLKLTEL